MLNEINCAFERFKNHEDITLLPFRLDTCPLSDDVYYSLGRIHMMDGALPPEELRIRELTDTSVGKRKDAAVPEKERQIHDARIRVDVEKGLHGRRKPVVNPAKGELLKKDVAQ